MRIFTGGSGFATGSGLYNLTLPVAISDQLDGLPLDIAIGKSFFLDASATATSTDMTVMYSPSTNLIFFRKQDGDAWRHNAPVTLAQNDKMVAHFCYPTKVA